MKYEPCKKSEDNFLANRKFRSCCNIKIVNSIFIELCMKGDSSVGLKREITPVKCIILESKSEMCKWSIGLERLLFVV